MISPYDLYAAPERLPLRLLDMLLDAADVALHHEHTTIDDAYGAHDPPTLIAARLLITRIHELRQLLRWYDHAVLDALGVGDSSLPF